MTTPLQAKLAKLPKRITNEIMAHLKSARQALKDGNVNKAKLFIMCARDRMRMVIELPIRIAAAKEVEIATKTKTGYVVCVKLGAFIFERIEAKSVRDFERKLKAAKQIHNELGLKAG